jgi:hypothetical protein
MNCNPLSYRGGTRGSVPGGTINRLLKNFRDVIARSGILRRGNLEFIDLFKTEIAEFIPSLLKARLLRFARNDSKKTQRPANAFLCALYVLCGEKGFRLHQNSIDSNSLRSRISRFFSIVMSPLFCHLSRTRVTVSRVRPVMSAMCWWIRRIFRTVPSSVLSP